MSNDVLVMTKESPTAEAVSCAIQASDRLEYAGECRNLDSLTATLARKPSAAVVVDIDPRPMQMLEGLASVIPQFADTRFVLVSTTLDNKLILQAMQVGARHYIHKDAIKAELAGILERLLAVGSPGDTPYGSAISVLSAAGGCGATTIALNLANELRIDSAEPTLLIDGDYQYGAIGLYLGLRCNYGLAEVLGHSATCDPQLIRSSAVTYKENLCVLLSRSSGNSFMSQPPDFSNLENVLEGCKRAYRRTVVDAARVPIDVASDFARASDRTLIVMQWAVKDIHIAREMRSGLADRGVPPNRILTVVNRFQKRKTTVGLEEGRRALGCTDLHFVGNDFRKALQALDYGRSLADIAPISRLRRDLRALAMKAVSDVAQTATGENRP